MFRHSLFPNRREIHRRSAHRLSCLTPTARALGRPSSSQKLQKRRHSRFHCGRRSTPHALPTSAPRMMQLFPTRRLRQCSHTTLWTRKLSCPTSTTVTPPTMSNLHGFSKRSVKTLTPGSIRQNTPAGVAPSYCVNPRHRCLNPKHFRRCNRSPISVTMPQACRSRFLTSGSLHTH